MGVPMSTFPDADLGIPKGGVAPIHGRMPRSAAAALGAVVQPQGGQRHAQAPTCPSEGRSRVHPPPMSDGHPRIGVGPRRRALYGCRALGLDDTALSEVDSRRRAAAPLARDRRGLASQQGQHLLRAQSPTGPAYRLLQCGPRGRESRVHSCG